MPLPKAEADERGWVLTQRSAVLGDQYVYISPGGIKIVNPRQGVGSIVKPPNWDVLFFNDQTHLIYPLNYQQWKNKLSSKQRSLSNIKWNRGGSATIAGLNANEYRMQNLAARPKNPNDWISAEYWVARDIRVSPKLAELLAAAYGTPDNASVPLRLTYKTAAGKDGVSLDTYYQKVTAIPSNFFQGPTGYQLAKSEADVMLNNENRQMLNDLANDLGRTDSTGATSATIHSANGRSATITVPQEGIHLPNGKTVSKDQISKFLDAFKQSNKSGQ
jgi:hypothetical protein